MRSKFPLMVMIVMLALFLVGVAHLFIMRFQTGDVLPVYSTLRADPLGTKAFYDSLDEIHALKVERNYQDPARLPDDPNGTVFLLGLDFLELKWLDRDYYEVLDRIAVSGGRLVIAFYPEGQNAPWFRDMMRGGGSRGKEAPEKSQKGKDTPEDPDKSPPQDVDRDEPETPADEVTLTDHWGVSFSVDRLAVRDREALRAAEAPARLPGRLPWHSVLYFDVTDPDWRPIYIVNRGRPVIIERPYGRGTIVLVADSYFFSNEALREAPQSDLLAWLVGPPAEPYRRVIFDEAHLGVYSQPGVASLMKQYRLHGLLAGIFVLAVLFIWKNALPLAQPTPQAAGEDERQALAGRDSTAGLVSLLKRNVSENQVVSLCVDEWKKWSSETERFDRVTEFVKSADAKKKSAAELYGDICRILSEGKPWKKTRPF